MPPPLDRMRALRRISPTDAGCPGPAFGSRLPHGARIVSTPLTSPQHPDAYRQPEPEDGGQHHRQEDSPGGGMRRNLGLRLPWQCPGMLRSPLVGRLRSSAARCRCGRPTVVLPVHLAGVNVRVWMRRCDCRMGMPNLGSPRAGFGCQSCAPPQSGRKRVAIRHFRSGTRRLFGSAPATRPARLPSDLDMPAAALRSPGSRKGRAAMLGVDVYEPMVSRGRRSQPRACQPRAFRRRPAAARPGHAGQPAADAEAGARHSRRRRPAAAGCPGLRAAGAVDPRRWRPGILRA